MVFHAIMAMYMENSNTDYETLLRNELKAEVEALQTKENHDSEIKAKRKHILIGVLVIISCVLVLGLLVFIIIKVVGSSKPEPQESPVTYIAEEPPETDPEADRLQELLFQAQSEDEETQIITDFFTNLLNTIPEGDIDRKAEILALNVQTLVDYQHTNEAEALLIDAWNLPITSQEAKGRLCYATMILNFESDDDILYDEHLDDCEDTFRGNDNGE